jgi:hypothetical protein
MDAISRDSGHRLPQIRLAGIMAQPGITLSAMHLSRLDMISQPTGAV